MEKAKNALTFFASVKTRVCNCSWIYKPKINTKIWIEI